MQGMEPHTVCLRQRNHGNSLDKSCYLDDHKKWWLKEVCLVHSCFPRPACISLSAYNVLDFRSTRVYLHEATNSFDQQHKQDEKLEILEVSLSYLKSELEPWHQTIFTISGCLWRTTGVKQEQFTSVSPSSKDRGYGSQQLL